MISNCGHDENGKYEWGMAGDQTGGEWAVISWYNRPWNCVLRHPDLSVQNDLAYLARAAANNNLIGYDQKQRETYWEHLKASNYDPAKITIACEADCSSGVAANVKAAGYRRNIQALKGVSPSLNTRVMRTSLKSVGFQVLTDSKYLTSAKYLLPGDILLNDASHVATNLDIGANASSGGGTTGWYRFSPKDVFLGCQGTSVYLLQEIFRARGFKGADGKELKLDWDCGANTVYAINSYQSLRRQQGKEIGTNGKNDSCCGPSMWEDLIAIPNYTPETVKVGSIGTSVYLLQEILKARGFYTGALDWNFGRQTMDAVNAYQEYRYKQGKKLTPTGIGNGICDSSMWEDLIAI